MNARVMIIEDERELADLIRMYLEHEGVEAEIAESAERAFDLLQQSSFDLIVLDINLPGIDGFEFLQQLRRTNRTLVVIVSAREADEDIVMGLGMGADEFVSKPFAPRVLVARIRALLRRAGEESTHVIDFGPFHLDVEGYLLFRGEDRITLSSKEFEVLRHLVRHPGQAMTSERIYREVWRSEYGDLTSVAVYIRRLRKKIEDDPRKPRYIQTIHGSGYRFNPETLRSGAVR